MTLVRSKVLCWFLSGGIVMKKRIPIFLAVFFFTAISSVEAWRHYPSKHENRVHGKDNHYKHKAKTSIRGGINIGPIRMGIIIRKCDGALFIGLTIKPQYKKTYVKENQNRRYNSGKQKAIEGSSNNQSGTYSSDRYEVNLLNSQNGIENDTHPASNDKARPNFFIKPPMIQNPQSHDANATIWIPAKKKKVWVPGYWSYGIRRVWRKDHWHHETDPEERKWEERHYNTRVFRAGLL